MVDNSHLAISLLDLQLGGRGLDTQGVVIGGIDDHDGYFMVGVSRFQVRDLGYRWRVESMNGRGYGRVVDINY